MIDALKSYRRQVVTAFRRNPVTWRYLFNTTPALIYRASRPRLSSEAARVVDDLNRDGLATTTIGGLGVAAALFSELTDAVTRLQHAKAHELDEARRAVNDTSQIGTKTFNVELLGPIPALDPADVFCRLAIERPILDVANAYFGMLTRLRYFNVWQTLASHAAPRESQLWHRDREDFLIMKVFVYLADVDRQRGAFIYAPGTHPKGAVSTEPAYALEGHVRRSTDAQMAAVVPADRWIEAGGPRGTIVFADTRGFHKGGLARAGDRLMYTCMFTSRASGSRELLERPRAVDGVRDRAVAFAMR